MFAFGVVEHKSLTYHMLYFCSIRDVFTINITYLFSINDFKWKLFCKYSIKLSSVISAPIPFSNEQPAVLWPNILQNPHYAIFFELNNVEFDLIFFY